MDRWENERKYTKLKWCEALLKLIVGSDEICQELRKIIVNYYMGASNDSLINWSGADKHLATVNF